MNRAYISDQVFIILAIIGISLIARSAGVPAEQTRHVVLALFVLIIPSLVEGLAQSLLVARQFKAAEALLRPCGFYRSMAWAIPIKYLGQLYLVQLEQLSRALMQQQKYSEAIQVQEKLLRFAKMRFGEDAPETVETMINVAAVQCLSGHPEAGLPVAKKALTLLENIKNPSRRHTENLCLALNNLGVVYINSDLSDDAHQLFEKSFRLKLNTLNEDHPSVSVAYENLGYSLLTAQKYEAAEKYLKKALDRRGPGVEFTATANNNYGEACRGLGRLDEAEEYLQKAMDIRLKTHGKNHPHMGYSFHNLAKLYADKGDTQKANAFYERALELREKILPPNHPDLLRTMRDYAAFLRKTDRVAEAERLEGLVARHSALVA
jgi:tetratricopeptide (TPR) repeat protein